MDNDIVS